MAGSGKGRSNGIARSRLISLSSTPILRSSRFSRPHAGSASSGQSEPTRTNAVRTPVKSTRTDATMAPRPTAKAIKLSSRPNTRASTASLASLAIKVNTPRSTNALPTPTKAKHPCRDWPGEKWNQRDRQPPQRDANGEPLGEPARPDQQRCGERPDHRACADGSGEGADTRLADIKQLESDHNAEYGECPAGERLRSAQADQQ